MTLQETDYIYIVKSKISTEKQTQRKIFNQIKKWDGQFSRKRLTYSSLPYLFISLQYNIFTINRSEVHLTSPSAIKFSSYGASIYPSC